MTNEEYNKEVQKFGTNYRSLNGFVMEHTVEMCTINKPLFFSIEETTKKQFVLLEDNWSKYDFENLKDGPTTNIIVSEKRSFEAASKYKGKKVAVLNFANNHRIGGAPYSSGAQEESLCRCSTLYPCLVHEKESFYLRHQKLYEAGQLNSWGNGDLIYSPDVVVFKTDESAPKMLPEEDWFKVDVITMAAPQMQHIGYVEPFDYGMSVLPRLRKVFEIAKKQGVEVLILGAWGCGAFKNPPEAVAQTFKILCNEYKFSTIEFPVYCGNDDPNNNYHVFKKVFEK